MEQFGKIFLMSFVVVSIYDIVKGFYKDNKVDVNSIVTAVLGIIVAILAQLDVFALLGVSFIIPYFGQVLTGLVISKGSNYVYDFITRILSLLKGNNVSSVTETETKVEEIEENATSENEEK